MPRAHARNKPPRSPIPTDEAVERPEGANAGDAARNVRRLFGEAGQTAGTALNAATEAVADAGDRITRSYASARHVVRDITRFTQRRPFVALGLAAAAGLVVGMLAVVRVPTTIYVKPRD